MYIYGHCVRLPLTFLHPSALFMLLHMHILTSFPLYNVFMPTLTSFLFKCGGGGEGCYISVLMTYWTISRCTQLTFFWESNMTLIGFWNKSIFLVVIRGIYDLFYKKNPYDASSFCFSLIDRIFFFLSVMVNLYYVNKLHHYIFSPSIYFLFYFFKGKFLNAYCNLLLFIFIKVAFSLEAVKF